MLTISSDSTTNSKTRVRTFVNPLSFQPFRVGLRGTKMDLSSSSSEEPPPTAEELIEAEEKLSIPERRARFALV